MRTVIVVAAVTALVMGVFSASPTGGFADEAVRITGEAKKVQLGEVHLQLIPTNRGVFIVQGELVNDKLTTVMLMEGARPAQIKMAPHTHRQTLVVHRELEEQWKGEIEENARIQGD